MARAGAKHLRSQNAYLNFSKKPRLPNDPPEPSTSSNSLQIHNEPTDDIDDIHYPDLVDAASSDDLRLLNRSVVTELSKLAF